MSYIINATNTTFATNNHLFGTQYCDVMLVNHYEWQNGKMRHDIWQCELSSIHSQLVLINIVNALNIKYHDGKFGTGLLVLSEMYAKYNKNKWWQSFVTIIHTMATHKELLSEQKYISWVQLNQSIIMAINTSMILINIVATPESWHSLKSVIDNARHMGLA